ncbi:MAG: hypothetical protein ABUL50_06440 [Rhizobacter sp.]
MAHSTSLHRLLATSTILAACALSAACSHTPNGNASASSASMSSNAGLGPVYFGDTMAFGHDDTTKPATHVAATITLEY